MKKVIICAIFLITLFYPSFSYAFVQYSNHSAGGYRPVLTTGTQTNYIQVPTQARHIKQTFINTPADYNYIVTPPPPPPRREVYRYKDFAGTRRFPRRSYYIPSYCLPTSRFYNNNHNPFCSQYLPYGHSMYLDF